MKGWGRRNVESRITQTNFRCHVRNFWVITCITGIRVISGGNLVYWLISKKGLTLVWIDERVPQRPGLGTAFLLVPCWEEKVFQLVDYFYFPGPHPDGWRLWRFPFKRNACFGNVKEMANNQFFIGLLAWKRKKTGSSNFWAVCLTSNQNCSILGQVQKIWSNVPHSSWHLQQQSKDLFSYCMERDAETAGVTLEYILPLNHSGKPYVPPITYAF